MKYCIGAHINNARRNDAHEVKFNISSLMLAIGYAEEHPDKRVIVSIANLRDEHCPKMDKLYSIHTELKNIHYEFKVLGDLIAYTKNYWEKNKDDRHCMFGQPVITWAMVLILKFYHVTDILITEPLTFTMNDVVDGIKSEGIAVRVRPAMTKHMLANGTNDSGIHHFWILPQHQYVYENYIDVIDFSFEESDAREETLFKLFLAGKYDNDLHYYLENFEGNLPASMIDEDFVRRRLLCRQTCLINDRRCHYCDTLVKLAEQLKVVNKKEES